MERDFFLIVVKDFFMRSNLMLLSYEIYTTRSCESNDFCRFFNRISVLHKSF
jgi:hypothetical protein